MKKHKVRRILLALALCGVFLLEPVVPLRVYAGMDPEVIAAAKEAAKADADEADGESSADEFSADGSDWVAEEDDEEETAQQAEETQSTSAEGKYQNQIDDINTKLDALKDQKKEIEQSLNATKDAKAKELATKNYLDQQIDITRSEIGLLEQRITVLGEQITEKEEDIALKQADIDENYQQFKKRLRAMQLNDDSTTLGLVLGADSFTEFLSHTETVTRIAEHDRALMQRLTVQREELELDKLGLEGAKEMLEEDRRETEQKRQNLSVQLSAAQVAVQNLEQMEKDYLADLAKNEAAAKAMEKELEDIYRRIEWDKNPYVGGEMAWPLPGYYTVTSKYGWRFSGKDFHTGMDISGASVHGKSIVAANGGTVAFVNLTYSPGVGYGKYLIVDHGGGRTTLYAHCSNIVVKVGDKVSKGQKIAEVGSTGWSTGPHLHFEVRNNGAHTDPYPYVVGK